MALTKASNVKNFETNEKKKEKIFLKYHFLFS